MASGASSMDMARDRSVGGVPCSMPGLQGQEPVGPSVGRAGDARDVGARLGEGRHAAVARDVAGTGVVGGERERRVAAEAREHAREVAAAAVDVGERVVGLGDAELARPSPASAA